MNKYLLFILSALILLPASAYADNPNVNMNDL